MDERMNEWMIERKTLKSHKYCVEHDLSHLAAIKTYTQK